ncbi:MAG: PRC-barrel domain-containing protein [Pseudomonadota bacterium]
MVKLNGKLLTAMVVSCASAAAFAQSGTESATDQPGMEQSGMEQSGAEQHEGEATTQTQQSQEQMGQAEMRQAGVKKASELMGKTVRDDQGEELGEIDDFALDMEQGKLAYVVLSTGGMFQEKLVGIPASALQSDPQTEEFIASVSQQELEQAQELPEDNWPQQPTVAAAGASGEQAGTEQQEQDFASLDQDGDGYISQSEAEQAGMSEQFQEMDQNADQQVDRSEFAAYETGETGEQPMDEMNQESPMDEESEWETESDSQQQEGDWEQEQTEQDF